MKIFPHLFGRGRTTAFLYIYVPGEAFLPSLGGGRETQYSIFVFRGRPLAPLLGRGWGRPIRFDILT